eukprot:COSAG02_NODE_2031_length_10066_cov_115.646333_7_plen_110_part_00
MRSVRVQFLPTSDLMFLLLLLLSTSTTGAGAGLSGLLSASWQSPSSTPSRTNAAAAVHHVPAPTHEFLLPVPRAPRDHQHHLDLHCMHCCCGPAERIGEYIAVSNHAQA